jgi:hypothetical protein
LNWYRGQDIFWQLTPFLIGRKPLQPTLYVGGTDDAVAEFARPYVDNLEKSVPHLWNKMLLPGVLHWTEQEAPGEVNRLMVELPGQRGRQGLAKRTHPPAAKQEHNRSSPADSRRVGPRGHVNHPAEFAFAGFSPFR